MRSPERRPGTPLNRLVLAPVHLLPFGTYGRVDNPYNAGYGRVDNLRGRQSLRICHFVRVDRKLRRVSCPGDSKSLSFPTTEGASCEVPPDRRSDFGLNSWPSP
jgi:hypothetical protein